MTNNRLDEIRALPDLNTGPKFGYTQQLCDAIRELLQLLDARPAVATRTNDCHVALHGKCKRCDLPVEQWNVSDVCTAVAGDARELVDQCAVALEQNEANKRVFVTAAYDTLVERITAYANQQALQAALHEANTWRAFILNDPRYAELWATFGEPEDLSADDVAKLIEAWANQQVEEFKKNLPRTLAWGNQRYREGVQDSIEQARHSGCSTCGETIADAIAAALLKESE